MGLDGYCHNVLLLYILAIIKAFIKIMQIVTPLMVIVLLSFSLYHYITNPEKGKSKVITVFKNGFISMLVIFLVPTVFNNILHDLSNGSYATHCWDEASTEVNFSGSFIDEEKINYDIDPISGSINTNDYKQSQKEEENESSSSSSPSNVTGDTAKLLEVAKKRWLDVVHGGYKYDAGSNQVPFSPPHVDCSTYVSDVLYHFGYTDFKGLQHHTKEFMQTDWHAKYGWTEIQVDGGQDVSNIVKPGDILVRTNPGGYGHVNLIVSVENGVVKAYDCGTSGYWQNEKPIVVGKFIRDKRPGKIIRIT